MAVATTLALVGTAVAVTGSVAQAISAKNDRDDAEAAARDLKNAIKDKEDSLQDIVNPYAHLTNEMANLAVATQASQFQAEEADIALANTLDTLRATGTAAGGATALAQAALQSKRGISANIQQQEASNEKMRAEGEMRTQVQKGQGEVIRMRMQEERDMTQLDRLQGELDQERQNAVDADAAMWGAIGSIGTSIVGGAGAFGDAKAMQAYTQNLSQGNIPTPPIPSNMNTSDDWDNFGNTGNEYWDSMDDDWG